jgi:hypothetical protein
MKNYDFTNEQVQLLKEAINAYSEQCAVFSDNEGTEDKIVKMSRLYRMLSNRYDILNSEEEEVHVYPICDY